MKGTSEELQPNCEHLASLHPDYSQLELAEAQALLRQYFDLAREIFSRMERDKQKSDLTGSDLNPMVNPPPGIQHPSIPKT